ncbi:transcriptional regulator ATRX homolog isoform X3 [Dermacentor albipictus]|uniref:transcriptional regulator ATRX homolog isoform X3 n=1 Tax=Dermacentor albipictus TaxID=60249 RepID=UPI0038FD2E30
MTTNAMPNDVSVKREPDPGCKIAVNVSSKRNITGGKGEADLGTEEEDDDEGTRKSGKEKRKKKKKKKQRVAESSTSSDGDESDTDRAKYKKKATAGVSTRINIFTGAQGPPGIGMQSGVTGPNALSSAGGALPVIQQQVPMLPMIQEMMSVPKKNRSKRSTKSAKSKSSQGEGGRQSAPGMPAVIPPAMAGLVSGPDGQDVLVIPMPPGMKLPPLGAGIDQIFGAGFPFTDPQQQQPKKKKKKSIDAAEGSSRNAASNPAVDEQGQQAEAGTGRPAPDAIAGSGAIVDEAMVEAALQSIQAASSSESRVRHAKQEAGQPSPSEAMPEGRERPSSVVTSHSAVEPKKTLSSEDETNTMALLIFAAVVGIIVIVIIVFIVATASTSSGTSAPATTLHHEAYGSGSGAVEPAFRARRHSVRRHPRPHKGYIGALRRFKQPAEAYWNIK